MGDVAARNMENFVSDNKAGEPKMAKRTIGLTPRRTLGDLSNMPQHSPTRPNRDEKEHKISFTSIQYIDQLRKENMRLMKLLAERNKIIELSQIELNGFQTSLQKMQQQNLQLAVANSQMLRELNSGKDMRKALHHELGCKNSLLKARDMELKAKRKKGGMIMHDEARVSSQADEGIKNTSCNNNRRWRSKNKSWAPSNSEVMEAGEKTENKRQCLRRKSARFKCREEPEPSEDLFEIDEAKFPVSSLHDDDPVGGNSTSIFGLSVKKEDDRSLVPILGAQEFRRSSIGRPMRRAAEKVQSYKEIPVNVKMRRPE